MANSIIEFLKRRFRIKKKSEKLDEITRTFEEEFYSPLENYEWADKIRDRQDEHYK
jgi:hypothetical protein